MTTEVTEMVETVGKTPFRKSPRHGFSFVEILFAVMILGIGFIMIAGIFPVAINQTQSNGDETIAASTARQGATVIASMPNTASLMVSDGTVHRFGPSGSLPTTIPALGASGDPDLGLWNELNGAQILSEDPRYAWVPFYCRRNDAYALPGDWAQITIIAVRVRNHAAYVPSTASGGDLTYTGAGANAIGNLIGKPVGVSITRPAPVPPGGGTNIWLSTPDQITLTGTTGAIAPGAFVIIATDPNASTVGSAVGWTLKIGAQIGTTNSYFLQPGGDTKNSPAYPPSTGVATETISSLTGFIVGQGADPDTPSNFSGGAQDVMAYTTFIPLH
jgi:type II secretory pathway pseudopilin PulG